MYFNLPLNHPKEQRRMVKQIITSFFSMIFGVVLLSSCTAIKSLNFTSNRQVASVNVSTDSRIKFIDDISITPQVTIDKTDVKPEAQVSLINNHTITRNVSAAIFATEKKESDEIAQILASRSLDEEAVSSVQLKYAVLLNTELESLPSKTLLENVDDWYGVRYRTGGNTKTGVDCSGFTVAVYAAVYGIALPRVSREQYRISQKISTTELQEGDLVFFNTRGSGVSHVGVYLGNNKFIHASVSKGVMVNGLFEPYYLQRFYGAGRITEKQIVAN